MSIEALNGTTSPQDAPQVEETIVDKEVEPSTSSEPTPDEATEKEAKKKEWAQRRINDITKKRYEAEGRAKALEQESAYLKQQIAQLTGQQVTPTEKKEQSPEEFKKQAYQEASLEIRAKEAFKVGNKEIPHFQEKAALLGQTFEIDNNKIEVLLDADAPHKVINYLADNLDEAEEILSLPPAKLARAIAKLEVQLESSKPKPSAAPKPLEPVKQSGRSEGEPDPSDTKRWVAWRNKHSGRR